MKKLLFIYIVLFFIDSRLHAQSNSIDVIRTEDAEYISFNDGTDIVSGSSWDDGFVQINIGFAFPLINRTFSTVKVNYNGYLIFNEKDILGPTPLLGDSSYILQPYNTDLAAHATKAGSISYKNITINGLNTLIIQYKDVGFWSESTSYTNFQIHLTEDGSFQYHYGKSEVLVAAYGGNSGPEVGAGLAEYAGSFGNYITRDGVFLAGSIASMIRKKEFFIWLFDAPEEQSVLSWDFSYDQFNFSPLRWELYLEEYPRSIALNGTKLKGDEFGAVFGINRFKDNALAERQYFSKPALVKGVVFQAFGEPTSLDTVEFSIYDIGDNELPQTKLTTTKVGMNCINYNGLTNEITFDDPVLISDSCFLVLNLPEYQENQNFGLYVIVRGDEANDPKANILNRSIIQLFNGEWIDINESSTIKDRLNEDDSLEIIIINPYFSMTPIFNFDTNNTSLEDKRVCANFDEVVTSLIEVPRDGISIFPNPASSKITIVNESPKSTGLDMTVSLYDLAGNKILVGKAVSVELNTQNLEKGVYLLKIDTGVEVIIKRVVKK